MNKEQIACGYIKAPWNLLLVLVWFFYFSQIPFLGSKTQVAFACINTVPIDIMSTESERQHIQKLLGSVFMLTFPASWAAASTYLNCLERGGSVFPTTGFQLHNCQLCYIS